MSIKGTVTTYKVVRGKINYIRQIEDVNALYAEAERLIDSAKQVIDAENVLSAAEEATKKAELAASNAETKTNEAVLRVEQRAETAIKEAVPQIEGAIKNANDAANRAKSYLEDAERLRTEIEDDWGRIRDKDIPEYLQSLVIGLSRIAYIELLSSNWEGSESLYSQVVSIDGVTENSKIDINPSIEQLAIFHEKDIAFVAENENGIVTVYCIGQRPTANYQMQVTITEVNANG